MWVILGNACDDDVVLGTERGPLAVCRTNDEGGWMGSRRRGDRRRTVAHRRRRSDTWGRLLVWRASSATRRTALLSDVLVSEITTGGVADHEHHRPPTDDDLRDFSMPKASLSSSDTRREVVTTTRPRACHMTCCRIDCLSTIIQISSLNYRDESHRGRKHRTRNDVKKRLEGRDGPMTKNREASRTKGVV